MNERCDQCFGAGFFMGVIISAFLFLVVFHGVYDCEVTRSPFAPAEPEAE